MELLQKCDRLYQIRRLLASNAEAKSEVSEHFSFGHAFGASIQNYLITQDRDSAIFAGWQAYWPEIETDKKNVPRFVALALKAFQTLDNLLLEYEVENVSDLERGFIIQLDGLYYYVGYIDAVLRHRFSGRYYVLESKSTGILLDDLAPLYKNSGQALGYSIGLDRMVGQSLTDFGVIYLIGQLARTPSEDVIKLLTFKKTLRDRLSWFLSLGLDLEKLERMAVLNVYPQRGGSCLQYNRACSEFGSCGLTSLDFPYKESEEERKERLEKEKGLPIFHLDEVIADHLARLGKKEIE